MYIFSLEKIKGYTDGYKVTADISLQVFFSNIKSLTCFYFVLLF